MSGSIAYGLQGSRSVHCGARDRGREGQEEKVLIVSSIVGLIVSLILGLVVRAAGCPRRSTEQLICSPLQGNWPNSSLLEWSLPCRGAPRHHHSRSPLCSGREHKSVQRIVRQVAAVCHPIGCHASLRSFGNAQHPQDAAY